VLDLGHFGGASIVTMAAVGGAHSVVASAEGNVFTWGRGFFGTHTPPPHTGFPMSAHLSRLRLFQQHLRSLFWVWVWVWDWVTLLLARSFTRSSSSCHPHFTQYPVPSRSLVRDGQTSSHMPRLVVSHSVCPSLSPSPPAHSFIIGPAVINTTTQQPRVATTLHLATCLLSTWPTKSTTTTSATLTA
jgi:hypothetical protein